jgi:hypothetical protein
MIDKLRLYISAAPELRHERDVLARAMTEIPTSLGFVIKQTPPSDREPDLDAVVRAHIHVLLIGRDIQAPVGLEWACARRNDNTVALFYKTAVPQTQAAQAFVRDVSKVGTWRTFEDAADLRRQVLRLIVDDLLTHQTQYSIVDDEPTKLRNWRATLKDGTSRKPTDADEIRTHTDTNAVILTTDRFVPSDGKLLRGNGGD